MEITITSSCVGFSFKNTTTIKAFIHDWLWYVDPLILGGGWWNVSAAEIPFSIIRVVEHARYDE